MSTYLPYLKRGCQASRLAVTGDQDAPSSALLDSFTRPASTNIHGHFEVAILSEKRCRKLRVRVKVLDCLSETQDSRDFYRNLYRRIVDSGIVEEEAEFRNAMPPFAFVLPHNTLLILIFDDSCTRIIVYFTKVICTLRVFSSYR